MQTDPTAEGQHFTPALDCQRHSQQPRFKNEIALWRNGTEYDLLAACL